MESEITLRHRRDTVRMTGPDRVSINPFGRDLFTTAPIDRALKSKNQLSGWNERPNQQVQ